MKSEENIKRLSPKLHGRQPSIKKTYTTAPGIIVSPEPKCGSSNLRSISIKNYRGFFDEQKICFAQPDGKNKGSGLTIITGTNNSGKTSILEAITVLPCTPGVEVLRDEHQGANNSSIIVETTAPETFHYSYEIIGGEVSYQFKEKDGKWPDYIMRVIPTQRSSLDDLSHLRSSVGIDDNLLYTLLHNISSNEEMKRQFNGLLREIMPNFRDWTIKKDVQKNSEEHYYLVNYITNNGLSHSIDFLGLGLISIFGICTSLVLETSTILIIDEPELSLHPSAQKRLREILIEKSCNRQIIICTHSPYFICWKQLKNGTKLFRLNKYNDERCTVHELCHNDLEGITGYIDPTRYHLFDIAAKEIMFADKLLFVEGQVDVGIICHWAQKEKIELNFDMFGYGVNGWQNFHIFLAISDRLGIKKVAVLYDKAKEKDIDQARNVHLDEDLKQNKDKYTNYLFLQLKTEDIIDKKDKKKGTFDKTGNLKEEYSAHFAEIVVELVKYFSK